MPIRLDFDARETIDVRRSYWRAAACAAIVSCSALGLLSATGAHSVNQALFLELPSLRSAWNIPAAGSPSSASLPRTAMVPIVLTDTGSRPSAAVSGDEGFWLSSRALSGNASNALSLGDTIAIAGHAYTVTELKPVAASSAGKEVPALTLVVAREVVTRSSEARATDGEAAVTEPRLLRFLIETMASASASADRAPHGSL